MKPDVADQFQEVYQEIDLLKEAVKKLEALQKINSKFVSSTETWTDSPRNPEGHPIPEYDEKQCEVLFKAVFKNADKIRTAEMNLIDCVYDFLDHRDTYPAQSYGFDQELRAWGEQDYKNYRAIEEAAEALSDL